MWILSGWRQKVEGRSAMEKRCVMMATLLTVLGFSGVWEQASAEGCYWVSRCQNLWMGGCGSGYLPVETSNDCRGLCAMPQYPTCPPFFTRFQCCTGGMARESTSCSRCPNKVDLGNEWICCTDCSEPTIVDGKRKIGYCQTDAALGFQPKPRELFKWNIGNWKSCSGRCKKATKSREVKCLRYLEDAPQRPTVVGDEKCSALSSKPAPQEPCTPQHCLHASHKHEGLPLWAIVMISLTSFAAACGLAVLGIFIYKRRTDDTNHGFVYVMLDSY